MSDPNEPQIWFVQKGQIRKGPYNLYDLQQRIALGKIAPEDLFWRAGMRTPKPLDKIKALQALRQAPDPGITHEPLAETREYARIPTTEFQALSEAKPDDLASEELDDYTNFEVEKKKPGEESSKGDYQSPLAPDHDEKTPIMTAGAITSLAEYENASAWKKEKEKKKEEAMLQSLQKSKDTNIFVTNVVDSRAEAKQSSKKAKRSVGSLSFIVFGFLAFTYYQVTKPTPTSIAKLRTVVTNTQLSFENIEKDTFNALELNDLEEAVKAPNTEVRAAVARSSSKPLKFYFASNLPAGTSFIVVMSRPGHMMASALFIGQSRTGPNKVGVIDTKMHILPEGALEVYLTEGNDLPDETRKVLAGLKLEPKTVPLLVEKRLIVVKKLYQF